MPDVAQVSMMNRALFQLGNEPVPDLSDASLAQSNAAVKILRIMDDSREVVLHRHGWCCALTYATLSPMATPPANFRYAAAFQCPGDFVRIWEVANPFDDGANVSVVPPGDVYLSPDPDFYPEERWQLNTIDTSQGAQSVILTADALSSLNICYVRLASWGALDPHLRDAIAFDMAARAGFSVGGVDPGKLEKAAEAKILAAISVDATQEGGQPPYAPSIPAALRNYSR